MAIAQNPIRRPQQDEKKGRKISVAVQVALVFVAVALIVVLVFKLNFSPQNGPDISSTSFDSIGVGKDSNILPKENKPLDIVGAGFTADAFAQYLPALRFKDWKPEFIVLHNTAMPTFGNWHKRTAKQQLNAFANFMGIQMGWSKGPHLVVADDSIWVFNDLDKPGIHSPSWNKNSIGIQIVGDYNSEDLTRKVEDNTVRAIAAILARLNLPATSIRLHRDDPRTRGKLCSGVNVNRDRIVYKVSKLLKQ